MTLHYHTSCACLCKVFYIFRRQEKEKDEEKNDEEYIILKKKKRISNSLYS